MNKIKETLNDVLKSLYYGILIPVFTELQTVLEVGSINLSWSLLLKIFISSVLAYMVKKSMQKQIGAGVKVASNDDRNLPPPMGDPTKPKK